MRSAGALTFTLSGLLTAAACTRNHLDAAASQAGAVSEAEIAAIVPPTEVLELRLTDLAPGQSPARTSTVFRSEVRSTAVEQLESVNRAVTPILRRIHELLAKPSTASGA